MVLSMEHNYVKKRYSNSNNYCSVPGCFIYGKKTPGISFHKFPSENENIFVKVENKNKSLWVSRRQAWRYNLRIPREIKPNMIVCSRHFSSNDFFVKEGVILRRHLKKNAVPSQNLPNESYWEISDVTVLFDEANNSSENSDLDKNDLSSESSSEVDYLESKSDEDLEDHFECLEQNEDDQNVIDAHIESKRQEAAIALLALSNNSLDLNKNLTKNEFDDEENDVGKILFNASEYRSSVTPKKNKNIHLKNNLGKSRIALKEALMKAKNSHSL